MQQRLLLPLNEGDQRTAATEQTAESAAHGGSLGFDLELLLKPFAEQGQTLDKGGDKHPEGGDPQVLPEEAAAASC